ncbi:MAG: hypothetical protein R3F55_10865 [Alphaproteobacteria bacterium]
MIRLTSAQFDAFVRGHGRVACLMHRGGPGDHAASLARAVAERAGDDGWAVAEIDLDDTDDIAAAFGLDRPGTHLLIMRDAVVLYCEPLGPDATPGRIGTVIAGAQALDMARVRAEIEQERNARAIHAHRACPTTWRTR